MEGDKGKDQLVKSEIAQLPQWVINLQKELDNMKSVSHPKAKSVSPPKAINQGPRWMHAAPDTLHDQEPYPEDFPCDTYLRHAKESARGAVEIAKEFFPDVECKWGEAGLNEIIQDTSIIGVAVVLAGQTQVDMSLRLLNGGKHVLQEKPAAASGIEVERAISAYSSFNPAPIWAVAENYRFEPAFVEGKKLMAEIGDIINFHVIIEGSMNSSNPYFSSSWRRDFAGGFILDMGVHFISGLRMLLGSEVTSVSAITSHVDSTLPPPDHISSIIQTENGSSGVFVMVVSSRSPKVIWRMVGLKGTIQVERGNKDGKHGYTVILYTADGQSKSWFYPFSGVTEELKTFLSDISSASLKKDGSYQVEPRLSYVEGARDVAVLEAMLESGKRQGAPVPVKNF